MRRARALIGSLLALLVFAAVPADATIVDGIAAVVNGQVITLSDLAERVGPKLPPADATGDEKTLRHELLQSALDDAIDEKLLDHEAKAEGFVPTEAEIDSAVEDVQNANHIDQATLVKALAQQGLSMARYRQMLKAQLERMKLISEKIKNTVTVSDDEVKARYEKLAAAMPAKKEVHARDIYLPAGKDPAATKKALEAARARIEAGTPFPEVAKGMGGPLAASGGDLGWFSKGMMLPALEKVAFSLEPGEVSQVFQAGGGYHLLKVEGVRSKGGAQPLSEARAQIRQQILQEKLEKATNAYLASLRQNADIQILFK